MTSYEITSHQIEDKRERAIGDIEEGDFQRKIAMEMLPEEVEYGFLGDTYDSDGHSIRAVPQDRFELEGAAMIRAEFPRGFDPLIVARALHKFAAMLEGADRQLVANLRDDADHFEEVRRLENGDVEWRDARQEHLRDDYHSAEPRGG